MLLFKWDVFLSVNSRRNESLNDEPLNKRVKTTIPLSKLKIAKDSSVIATSSKYSEEIDIQIATYFYATNTPFCHSDNAYFQKMCKTLRPGYTPPSSHKLAGTLLDHVYDRALEETRETLRGTNVSMSLDGWSNVHNEPIICCSVMTEQIKTIDNQDIHILLNT